MSLLTTRRNSVSDVLFIVVYLLNIGVYLLTSAGESAEMVEGENERIVL